MLQAFVVVPVVVKNPNFDNFHLSSFVSRG